MQIHHVVWEKGQYDDLFGNLSFYIPILVPQSMCNFLAMEKKHYCCLCICTIIIISISLITIVCVCYVVYQSGKPLCHKSLEPMNTLIFWVQVSPAKLIEFFMFIWLCYHVIVGGNAAEMINVLTVLQKDMFLPRIYVAAVTDNMSLQKARVLEDNMVDRVGHLWFNFVLCLLL